MSERLEVDWTRCDAHGLCARLLPGEVTVDPWGFPVVDGAPLPADRVRDARRAAQACPALALRLTRT